MKNRKIKKGGSRASNAVMALKPEVCMDYSSPVIEGKYIDFDINDLSLYRTSGGGKRKTKRGGSRASDAVMKLGGKPCNQTNKAIRGGSRASNDVMKLGGKPCKQSNKAFRGGARLSQLSSNYSTHPALADCKFANFENAQKNSDVQQILDTNESVEVSEVDTQNQELTQRKIPLAGGGSSDWKSTLYSRGSYTAPNMPLAQFRAFTNQGDYVANDSMRTGKFLKGGKRKSRRVQKGSGSSDWKSTLYSRGSYTAPNMPLAQFRAFTNQGDYVANDSMRSAKFLKGGRRTNKKSKSQRKNRGRRNSNKKQSKNRRRNRKQRGAGGSDWKSTLYSRGSSSAPNMPLQQFRAFTQQAEYVPNDSMRSAAFMK